VVFLVCVAELNSKSQTSCASRRNLDGDGYHCGGFVAKVTEGAILLSEGCYNIWSRWVDASLI